MNGIVEICGVVSGDINTGHYEVPVGTTIRDFLDRHGVEEFDVPTICMVDGEFVLRADWDVSQITEDQIVHFIDCRLIPQGGGGGRGGSHPGLIIGALILVIIAPYLAGGILGAAGVGTAAGVSGGAGIAAGAAAAGGGITAGTLAYSAFGLTKGLIIAGGLYGLSQLFKPGGIRRPEDASPTYSLAPTGNIVRRRSPIPVQYGKIRIIPDLIEEPYTVWDGQKVYVVDRDVEGAENGKKGRIGRGVQYLHQVLYLTQGWYDSANARISIGNRDVAGLTEIDWKIHSPGDTSIGKIVPLTVDAVDTGNVPLPGSNEYQLIAYAEEDATVSPGDAFPNNSRGQVHPRCQAAEITIDEVMATGAGNIPGTSISSDTVESGEDGLVGEPAMTLLWDPTVTSDVSITTYGNFNGGAAGAGQDFIGQTFWLGDIGDDVASNRFASNGDVVDGCGMQDPRYDGDADKDNKDFKTKYLSHRFHSNRAGFMVWPLTFKTQMTWNDWSDDVGTTIRNWTHAFTSTLTWRIFHPARRRHIVASGHTNDNRNWVKVSPPFGTDGTVNGQNNVVPRDLGTGGTHGPSGSPTGNSRGHIRIDWTAGIKMTRTTGTSSKVFVDLTGGLFLGATVSGDPQRFPLGLRVQVREVNDVTGAPASPWYDVTDTHGSEEGDWQITTSKVSARGPTGEPTPSIQANQGIIYGDAKFASAAFFTTVPFWGPADEVNPLAVTLSFDMKLVPLDPNRDIDGFTGLPAGKAFDDEDGVWEIRVQRCTGSGVDPYNRLFSEEDKVGDDRVSWTGLRFAINGDGNVADRQYKHGTVSTLKARANANLNTQTAREVAYIGTRLIPVYGSAVPLTGLPTDAFKSQAGSMRFVINFPDHSMCQSQMFRLSGTENVASGAKPPVAGGGPFDLDGDWAVFEVLGPDTISFMHTSAALHTEDSDSLDVGALGDFGGASAQITSLGYDPGATVPVLIPASEPGKRWNPGYFTFPDTTGCTTSNKKPNRIAINSTDIAKGLAPGDSVTLTAFSDSNNNGTFEVKKVVNADRLYVDNSNGVSGDSGGVLSRGNTITDQYQVDPSRMQPVTNGIFCALDAMRDKFYGGGLTDDQIDLDSFARRASETSGKVLIPDGGGDPVPQPDDSYAFYFDQRGAWMDAVNQMLSVHRCKLIWVYNEWTLVKDEAQSLAVATFSPRNIVKNSFDQGFSFLQPNAPEWIEVEFFNGDTWQMDTVGGYFVDQDAESQEFETVRMPGITNRAHAWREARWHTADLRYRRMQVKFATEYEGTLVLPTQMVSVNHPIIAQSQGGDVTGFSQISGGQFDTYWLFTVTEQLNWRDIPTAISGDMETTTEISAWVSSPASIVRALESGVGKTHIGEGAMKLTNPSAETTMGITQLVDIPDIAQSNLEGYELVAWVKANNASAVGKEVKASIFPQPIGGLILGDAAVLSQGYWAPVSVIFDGLSAGVTDLLVGVTALGTVGADEILIDSVQLYKLGGNHAVTFKDDLGVSHPEPGDNVLRVVGADNQFMMTGDPTGTDPNLTMNITGEGRERTQFLFGRQDTFRRKCLVVSGVPRGFDKIDLDCVIDAPEVHSADQTGAIPPTDEEILETVPGTPIMNWIATTLSRPRNQRTLEVSWGAADGADTYDVEYASGAHEVFNCPKVVGGGTYVYRDELRCFPVTAPFGEDVYVQTVSDVGNPATIRLAWATGVHGLKTGDWISLEGMPDMTGLDDPRDIEGYFQVTQDGINPDTEVTFTVASDCDRVQVKLLPTTAMWAKDTGFIGFIFPRDVPVTPPRNVSWAHGENTYDSDGTQLIGPIPARGQQVVNIEGATSIPLTVDGVVQSISAFILQVDPYNVNFWITLADNTSNLSVTGRIVFSTPDGNIPNGEDREIMRVRVRGNGRTSGPWKYTLARSSESRLRADPVYSVTNGSENDSVRGYFPLSLDALLGISTASTQGPAGLPEQDGITGQFSIAQTVNGDTTSTTKTWEFPVDLFTTGAYMVTAVELAVSSNGGAVGAGAHVRFGHTFDDDAFGIITSGLDEDEGSTRIDLNSILGQVGPPLVAGKGPGIGDSTGFNSDQRLRVTVVNVPAATFLTVRFEITRANLTLFETV